MKFFLGVHQPQWATLTTVPLFISDVRLRNRKTLPRARGEVAIDSGAFSELQKHGGWVSTTARGYAERVRRYVEEIGIVWAAPMDWMVEPWIIHGGTVGRVHFAGTGLSTEEHLHRTVGNLIDLRSLAPDLPFIPTIQGYRRTDYERCIDLYDKAGIDLAAEPIVAVGSVCRRQSTIEAAEIIAAITDAVPKIRLHGYGIKTDGLGRYGSLLSSSDSMAWSQGARIRRIQLPGCTGHKTCTNCIRWAFHWRQRVLASLAGHATRTAAPRRTPVSRKPDAIARAAQRLTLCRFRDAVAVLEHDLNIRHAHRDGMTILAIAALMDVSPARVQQMIAEPDQSPVLDQIRTLRQRWGVDTDPATRAAADHIVADLVAAEAARTQPAQKEVVAPRRSGDATDPTLFDIP
ncbi:MULTISPECIES: DUF7221 family queuine tRNA-ribosyltransferase-like protein [Nocardia]|uniref:deazapurine DNA modification protein DpdA family protein n=1 Tax=Nocardia TaxID=1817 RepID=UPI002455132B|nr:MULTISPECIES: hypothetical protein [Nocardia]